MRGADVGTALMAVLFSADLSWLSPLFIFVGVVLFISRQDTKAGRIGRVLIGLGVMLLALGLVVDATEPLHVVARDKTAHAETDEVKFPPRQFAVCKLGELCGKLLKRRSSVRRTQRRRKHRASCRTQVIRQPRHVIRSRMNPMNENDRCRVLRRFGCDTIPARKRTGHPCDELHLSWRRYHS